MGVYDERSRNLKMSAPQAGEVVKGIFLLKGIFFQL